MKTPDEIRFLFDKARQIRQLAAGQGAELAEQLLELARELEARVTEVEQRR